MWFKIILWAQTLWQHFLSQASASDNKNKKNLCINLFSLPRDRRKNQNRRLKSPVPAIVVASSPQECQVVMNAVNSKKFSMLISAQQETHTHKQRSIVAKWKRSSKSITRDVLFSSFCKQWKGWSVCDYVKVADIVSAIKS